MDKDKIDEIEIFHARQGGLSVTFLRDGYGFEYNDITEASVKRLNRVVENSSSVGVYIFGHGISVTLGEFS